MRSIYLCLPLAVVGLAGCGMLPASGPIQSHGGPVRDHVSFVDSLRGRGLTVDPTGSVQQPFLHARSGTVLKLSQGVLRGPVEVQSYDYGSAGTARADLSRIDSRGNPAVSQVDWTGPPHFFTREKLVVVYVGSDLTLLKLLTDLVGTQVAGVK